MSLQPKKAKKKLKSKKNTEKYLRSLPLSYSPADKKQARLYLIILALIDGHCSDEDYSTLKKHVFYRLRHYSVADREDIFGDFILSIITGRSAPQVWHTNLFIQQRLTNAIKRFRRQTGRMVLMDDTTLEFFSSEP